MRLLGATFLAALGLVVACSTTREVELPAVTGSAAAGAVSMDAGQARVRIRSPQTGDRVTGRAVTVRAEVEGFRIVDRLGGRPRAGEGHVIFYRGQAYAVPVEPNMKATIGGTGSFLAAESASGEYVWRNVDQGEQVFAAQLVGSDGAPLRPPRVARVTVVVT